jgi:hypothetical protein
VRETQFDLEAYACSWLRDGPVARSGDTIGYRYASPRIGIGPQIHVNNLGAPQRHDWECAIYVGDQTIALWRHFEGEERAFVAATNWLDAGCPAGLSLRRITTFGALTWFAVDGVVDFDTRIVEAGPGDWRYWVEGARQFSGPFPSAEAALAAFERDFMV